MFWIWRILFAVRLLLPFCIRTRTPKRTSLAKYVFDNERHTNFKDHPHKSHNPHHFSCFDGANKKSTWDRARYHQFIFSAAKFCPFTLKSNKLIVVIVVVCTVIFEYFAIVTLYDQLKKNGHTACALLPQQPPSQTNTKFAYQCGILWRISFNRRIGLMFN